MNLKFLLTTLVVFLFSTEIFAQFPDKKLKGNATAPTDSVPDVVILNTGEVNDYVYGRKPYKTADNIIKVGVLYWGTGIYPIYYERKMTTWLGLQVGLGVTTRDFVADIVNVVAQQGGAHTDIFNNGNDVFDEYYDYQHRKAMAGVYVSFQPKFYLVTKAPTGFYISPCIEFKRYNYKANMVDETGFNGIYTKKTMKEHRNALDLTVHFGGQWLIGKRLAMEFSFNIGARKFWETRQDLGVDVISGNYVNGIRNYTAFRPQGMINLNIGGFF